jgi:hypothetical protein
MYNDRIVSLQSEVVKKMLDFSETFNSRDVSLMEQKYGILVSTIDEKLKEVSQIEPFEGDSNFKDTAVSLFQFYRDVAKKDYRELLDIFKKGVERGEFTQQELDKMDAISNAIGEREKILDDKFQQAQKNFAEKYKISLVDNELQKKINNK